MYSNFSNIKKNYLCFSSNVQVAFKDFSYFKYKYWFIWRFQWITQTLLLGYQSLKRNLDIWITKADKGNNFFFVFFFLIKDSPCYRISLDIDSIFYKVFKDKHNILRRDLSYFPWFAKRRDIISFYEYFRQRLHVK